MQGADSDYDDDYNDDEPQFTECIYLLNCRIIRNNIQSMWYSTNKSW